MTPMTYSRLAPLIPIMGMVMAFVAFAPAAMACDPALGSSDCGSGTFCSAATRTCVTGSGGPDGTPSTQPTSGADNKPVSIKAQQADSGDVYGPIMTRIMSLFAWLLGAATLMLDYAVYYGVVVMGGFVNSLSAVGVAWRILRDIGNILLIFGFLISGIAVIINLNIYGFGSKMLPMLLVAAVFINFSLFITEAIVDGGNLFATEVFQQINGGSIPGPAQFNQDSPVVNEGISNRIMSVLGLQSLYRFDATTGTTLQQNQTIFKSGAIYIGFLGIILFLVAAFVMFSLAFVIIARFVALIFLIVVAPVGFAGLAIPQLAGLASSWWKQLAEQTITAPVLLLLLYIALAVITDANFLIGLGVNGGNSNAAANNAANAWKSFLDTGVTGVSSFAGIFFSFLVAMGLLLVVVVASKRMSAFGASWATKMGGRLSFGAVGWGGRLAIGGAGNILASKRMQALATGRKGEGQIKRAFRYSLRSATSAGKGARWLSTYSDIRNIKGVAPGLSALGINAGTGATLTAKQMYEAGYGTKPVKKFFQESGAEYQAAAREADFRGAEFQLRTLDAQLANGTITKADYDRDIVVHEKVITAGLAKMSTKQLEELGGIKNGVEALVRNLSPEQFESLLKSDKITDSQKEEMRTNRYRSLNKAIDGGDQAAVRQWSAKDLAIAAPEILQNPDQTQTAKFVNLMSDGQYEAVVKNDRLNRNEQQQLRSFNSTGQIKNILEIAGGGAPSTPALVATGAIPAGMTASTPGVVGTAELEARRRLAGMKEKALAKLPSTILTNPMTMQLYTPKHLAAFMTDGDDLKPPDVATIAAAVRNPAHPNHAAIMGYLNPATNPVAATYWS